MAQELVLPAGRPLRLDDARGRVIRCMSGCAWITAQGLVDDVFLRGGESWQIPGGGRVVIEALGAATIRLRPAS